MDINKDDSFQIEDFENLDSESAINLNKKLETNFKHFQEKPPSPQPKTNKKDDKKDSNKEKSSDKIHKFKIGDMEFPVDIEPFEKIAKVMFLNMFK